MSDYTTSWQVRYAIPSIAQQTEVAAITAADQIKNEDPTTEDHANRIAWAMWMDLNSVAGSWAFMWPVAMNTSIKNSIANDPTGASVPDPDIQFVVNSNLNKVVDQWALQNPDLVNPPATTT